MEIGTIVTGSSGARYCVEKKLGEGRTSEAYLAKDEQTGSLVTLKVLRFGVAQVVAERFWREGMVVEELARAERQVSDGQCHVPRVLDLQHEGKVRFLALEFVAGTPLDRLLEQNGSLAEQEALLVADRVLRVLDLLHQHARRTSPHFELRNIWVEYVGGAIESVKLMRWNRVSDRWANDRSLPDDFGADDLARFATYFYRTLTGERADGRGEAERALERRAGERWEALSLGTRQVVAKALHPKPKRRYATAAHFRQAVQAQQALWQEDWINLLSIVKEALREPNFSPAWGEGVALALDTAARLGAPAEFVVYYRWQFEAHLGQVSLEALKKEQEQEAAALRGKHQDALAEANAQHAQQLTNLQRQQESQIEAEQRRLSEALANLRREQESQVEEEQRRHSEAWLELQNNSAIVEEAQRRHSEALANLQREHESQIKEEQRELSEALANLQGEHNSQVEAEQRRLSEAWLELQNNSATVEEAQRRHSEALANLQGEHESQIKEEQRELSEALANLRREQESQIKEAQRELSEALANLRREQESQIEEEQRELSEALANLRREQESQIKAEQRRLEQTRRRLEQTRQETEIESPIREPRPTETTADSANQTLELLPQERPARAPLVEEGFAQIGNLTTDSLNEADQHFEQALTLTNVVPEHDLRKKALAGQILIRYLKQAWGSNMSIYLQRIELWSHFSQDAKQHKTITSLFARPLVEWVEEAQQYFDKSKAMMHANKPADAVFWSQSAFRVTLIIEGITNLWWQELMPDHDKLSLAATQELKREMQRVHFHNE